MVNNLALYGNQPYGDIQNLDEWMAFKANEALEEKFKKKAGK
ncbi:hypothetical protein QMM96_22500 [Citrobacter freundii]|nr:hypothetical protein [Citrobacter freundii]MEB2478204.1 hypothetical protein [Citrobacter freundii]